MNHLATMLEILAANQLVANAKKCTFVAASIEYLGHLILADGIATNPVKIEAMENWLVPTLVKQLRGFLGLTRYYWKFVAKYDMIAFPLPQQLKRDKFAWNDEA